MPRRCSICQHPQHADIDAALVAGGSYREVARDYSASEAALFRHKQEHIPALLAKAEDAAMVASADTLLEQVRTLQRRALGILDTAEHAGDLRAATAAIREARECIMLLAKLMGELDERAQVNILTLSPDWLAVRSRLLAALEPFHDARLAVSEALDAHR